MSETSETFQPFIVACGQLATAARFAAQQLNELVLVVEQHREEWLCTGRGQWPDEFTLLNRYVRTDLEPPFIINT